MPQNVSPDRFVTLRGGMVVPAEVYLLVLDIEARGIVLLVTEDGGIEARPAGQLTDADRAAVRRWKRHVVMLMRHEADDAHLRQPAGAPQRAA